MSTSSTTQVQQDLLRKKYPNVSETQHVRTKDMWGGTHESTSEKEFVLDEKTAALSLKTIEYPASFYKCFDEAVVNAVDHFIRQINSATPVTYIKIDFSRNDGSITVENDGAGIECLKHPDLDIYIPQLIFGKLMTGSNINKDKTSATGGTNGVGIKIANALSTIFDLHIEWVDPGKKSYTYDQTWNTMDKCHPPKITSTATTNLVGGGLVRIRFLPDYKDLYKIDVAKIYDDVVTLFHYRVQLLVDYCTYVCSVAYKPAAKVVKPTLPVVTFNGAVVEPGRIDLAAYTEALSAGAATFDTNIVEMIIGPIPTNKVHPLWQVEIGIVSYRENVERPTSSKIPTLKGPICISNINGVAVKSGKHFDHILKKIVEAVATKMTSILSSNGVTFKKSMVTESIILRINSIIPSVGWTGQRKDIAAVTPANLKPYDIPADKMELIVDLFSRALLSNLKMTIGSNLAAADKSTSIRVEKYDRARFAGVAGKKHLCGLFLPEGDSARTMVRLGIAKNKALSFDYFGILTLRGVIINVRKESDILDESSGIFDFSAKLKNNKFFNSFKSVTGLDTKARYDPASSTYKTEMGKLKYGYIIGCVDQDHAGVGFIFSLIINMFLRFWPNLLKQGYLRRFITPVRRAIPKAKGGALKIQEFYSDHEYSDFLKKVGEDIKKYDIKYYKGLAGNSKADVAHMFNNFDRNLIRYIPTADSAEIYEKYFGDDADCRKEILKVPYVPAPRSVTAAQMKTSTIIVDDHARFEAKAHKLTNIHQKLPNFLDGHNECSRKVLFGAIKLLYKKNKEVKVAQLGASICSITDYLYGENCLIDSIPAKAAYYIGGRQLPPLVATSDAGIGSRDRGGADAGQSRYLKVKLNSRLVELIYPPVDNDLLTYVISDGMKVEPVYYVPTIPMAILESMELPADGWKISAWARDAIAVINEIRRQIKLFNPFSLEREISYLPPDTYGWTGEMRYINNAKDAANITEVSVGKYYYDEEKAMLKITELPLRVWTSIYKEKMEEKAEKSNGSIGEIRNYSPDNGVDIEIDVPMSFIKSLEAKGGNKTCDGVEEYFALRKNMTHNLNMVGIRGEVIEFGSYEEIFSDWFDVRRKLYTERVNRQRILIEIDIVYLSNKLRYINETSGENPIIKIKNLTFEEASELLSSNKYQKINRARYRDFHSISTADLKDVILNGKNFTKIIDEGGEVDDIDSDQDEGWSYKYLFATTDSERLKKSLDLITKKIEAKKGELEELLKKANIGPFCGSAFWLEELDKLEEVIKFGRKTNWFYEDFGKEEYK